MSLEKNWVLHISPGVYKFLEKIPRHDAGRIFSEIENLRESPFNGDVKKKRGEEDIWRKRAGSYRIFYELLQDKTIIIVFHVERRTSSTY